MWKSKCKAALVHGVVSSIVGLLAALLVFVFWYPGQLANFLGGVELFALILAVELCLGPLLSLVIYNPQKSRGELVRDYSVIAIVQILALAYGLSSTYQARPVFIVFSGGYIELVSAFELDEKDVLDATDERYRLLSIWGPRNVCVQRPSEKSQRSIILWSSLGGKDIHLLPRYYRECTPHEMRLSAYEGGDFASFLKEFGDYNENLIPESDFTWLPVHTRLGQMAFIYPKGEESKGYYLDLNL